MQQKWTSTYRTLVESRLKLDISYFDHLRSLIEKNYSKWEEQQARIWNPDQNNIPQYQEELRKTSKIIDTYLQQLKAIQDSQDKRRNALKQELNQRLANNEITQSELKRQMEEFESNESYYGFPQPSNSTA